MYSMRESDNNLSSFSVFEQTQVSLNSDFLSHIPTSVDQSSFFIEIADELQLTFCEQIDNGCPVFLGLWNNILQAEARLQECLRSWEEEKVLNDKSSEEVSILIPEGYIPSDLPGGSHLYLVPSDLDPMQRPQLLTCKLTSIKTDDKQNQKLPTTNGESELKVLYVDIAVNSTKKNKSSQDFDFKISSEQDQNPLDKLCQLLCIDEDENIEKSLSVAEKRRNYEENLPYKYFCDKCSFKAKRENHLVKHSKLHNKKKLVFCCELCDFKTICERSLSLHKVTHSAVKLTCKLCPFVTVTKSSLLKHTQAKHGPNYAKTVKCRHCDFLTTKPREMLRHLKLLHSKLQLTQIWKCTKCSYTSKMRAHLNRHMNDVHDGVRKFLCHYCGKNFKRNETLMEHKAIHGEMKLTFKCQFCTKAFTKPVHLQQHLVKHTSERPFLCDVCGKSYKTMQATKRHKRFMHSENIEKWPCPRDCERIFKYRTHLNQHLKQPCKKKQRLKTELKSEPDVVSDGNVPEELLTTPITIQVVYTEQLEPSNQSVT